jgi:hypothetical protein
MTARLKHWFAEDAAQDAYEYLLAAAVVVVVVAGAWAALTGAIPIFVGNACSSVNTAAADPDTCVNETP